MVTRVVKKGTNKGDDTVTGAEVQGKASRRAKAAPGLVVELVGSDVLVMGEKHFRKGVPHMCADQAERLTLLQQKNDKQVPYFRDYQPKKKSRVVVEEEEVVEDTGGEGGEIDTGAVNLRGGGVAV